MSSTRGAPLRLGLAGLLGLGAVLGCGTRVLELEGAPADAAAAASTVACTTGKGALGEPCLMCFVADGRLVYTDCKLEMPGAPPCAVNVGPPANECMRCSAFAPPGKSKTPTCLACKDWLKTPTGACRTCVWTGLPSEVLCEQCTDGSAVLPDACDQILQKTQQTL